MSLLFSSPGFIALSWILFTCSTSFSIPYFAPFFPFTSYLSVMQVSLLITSPSSHLLGHSIPYSFIFSIFCIASPTLHLCFLPVDSPSDVSSINVFLSCLHTSVLIQTHFVSYMENCSYLQLSFAAFVFPYNQSASNWTSGFCDYASFVHMPQSPCSVHVVP